MSSIGNSYHLDPASSTPQPVDWRKKIEEAQAITKIAKKNLALFEIAKACTHNHQRELVIEVLSMFPDTNIRDKAAAHIIEILLDKRPALGQLSTNVVRSRAPDFAVSVARQITSPPIAVEALHRIAQFAASKNNIAVAQEAAAAAPTAYDRYTIQKCIGLALLETQPLKEIISFAESLPLPTKDGVLLNVAIGLQVRQHKNRAIAIAELVPDQEFKNQFLLSTIKRYIKESDFKNALCIQPLMNGEKANEAMIEIAISLAQIDRQTANKLLSYLPPERKDFLLCFAVDRAIQKKDPHKPFFAISLMTRNETKYIAWSECAAAFARHDRLAQADEVLRYIPEMERNAFLSTEIKRYLNENRLEDARFITSWVIDHMR